MYLNRFTGIGNVVSQPELQETDGGKLWTKFPIAVNEYYKKDGKVKQFTTFIPVVAWDKWAKNICKGVRKGQPLLVEGPIRVKHYTDRKGEKKTSFQVEGSYFNWEPKWQPKSATQPKTQEDAVIEGVEGLF